MVTREIPQRDRIEVFVNDRGFVAISQGDALGNDPSVIDLPHEDVPKLVELLQDAMEEAKRTEEEIRQNSMG